MSASYPAARRVAFPPNWPARIGLALLAIYVIYAAQTLDFTWARFITGIDHGGRFLSRMFPPNVAPDKLQLLYDGMTESLQIAVLSTVFGVALAIPLGLAAARNLSPAPLAWFCRGLIALLRTFHPIIVAILFVKAVGFGALAGVLALIVASMSFLSKLLAEAVEEMSMNQIEAVRATGASFLSVVVMGVVPQVMARFVGFCAYQLDSNLRNSALVGSGRRRRHRCDAVHSVPALRLRLRADHRARHHRGGDGWRVAVRLHASAVPMSATAQTAPLRQWQRFSPAERIMRSVFYLIALIAIVWSLRSIEIIPEFLYDAPQQTADLFVRMWPIDWAWYPKVVHAALMETLHTATLGTILAVAMAAPVALMVASNVTHSVLIQSIGRFILVATRSVHAMVWALFFVAVFGPGALAGTLAIAVHSIGFTGKFLSEAIEEAKPGPIEALKATGAPPLAVLIKGIWPQVKPAFLALAMFRWDINVRESAVLGLVGGGGLGMALDTALSNLYWDQAGLVLCVIFAVVIAAEIATSWMRSRII